MFGFACVSKLAKVFKKSEKRGGTLAASSTPVVEEKPLAPFVKSHIGQWNIRNMELDDMPDDFLDRMDDEDTVPAMTRTWTFDRIGQFELCDDPEIIAVALDRTELPHRLDVHVGRELLSDEALLMSLTLDRTDLPYRIEGIVPSESFVPFHRKVLEGVQNVGLGDKGGPLCCSPCSAAAGGYGVVMAKECQRIA
ncbi:hypothetical protein Q8F55_000384 [Vanrija albida]|uniref:Uncharacterized protein n=1 Tax=Vanrija albida TaxID=181172 RepID=A0ABR3QDN9_9TREE